MNLFKNPRYFLRFSPDPFSRIPRPQFSQIIGPIRKEHTQAGWFFSDVNLEIQSDRSQNRENSELGIRKTTSIVKQICVLFFCQKMYVEGTAL